MDSSLSLFEAAIIFVEDFLSLHASYFGFELSNLEIFLGLGAIFLISYFFFKIMD